MISVQKRPYIYSWTGNSIFYQLYSTQAAANPDVHIEYEVMFRFTNAGAYEALIRLEYSPVAGIAKIELKDILNSKLQFALPGFSADEKTVFPVNEQTCNFYIRFREITPLNSNPSWDSTEVDHYRFAIKGGISYFRHRGNNYWTNYFNVKNPFLTWQPSGRLAVKEERMYLAFLHAKTGAGDNIYRSVCKVTFHDGSTHQFNYPMTVAVGMVHYIPTGYNQLGLGEIDINKRVYFWEIYLERINDPLDIYIDTEVYRYYLDNRNDYRGTTITFRNSLGGLDSIRVMGIIEEDVEYEFDTFDQVNEPDYFDGTIVTPQQRIFNSRERLVLKGFSGNVSKAEQEWLRDLFHIRDTYQEIDKKWIPILVLNGSGKFRSSEDSRYFVPITFVYANEGNEHFTPAAAALGDGVFNANVCLAEIRDVVLDVDTSGATAVLTVVSFTVYDPQAAGITQYTYQIPGIHATPSTALVAGLPLVIAGIPKEESYSIVLRPVCPNNILGTTTTTPFNTIGAGAGGGSTVGNSTVLNGSSQTVNATVNVNGLPVFTGIVPDSGGTQQFDVPDTVGAAVQIQMPPYSPSYCQLVTNAGADPQVYIGTIIGTTVNFSDVDIIDGFLILIN